LQRSAHGCEPADRETHHDGVVDAGVIEHRDEVVGHVPHREALVMGPRSAVPSVVEIEDPVPRLDHRRNLRPLPTVAEPAVAEEHGRAVTDVLIEEVHSTMRELRHRQLLSAGCSPPTSHAAGTAAEHLTAETRRTPRDATELPPGPDTTCLLSRRVRP
jgi:hypothetical protein